MLSWSPEATVSAGSWLERYCNRGNRRRRIGQLPVPDVVEDQTEVNAYGTRAFDTPRLERDGKYVYKMAMTRRIFNADVTQVRRIVVTPGKPVTVDFTKPDLANTLAEE